eukprot:scaffold74364_cov70-Cyclotella_meneghiniana.AAC.3
MDAWAVAKAALPPHKKSESAAPRPVRRVGSGDMGYFSMIYESRVNAFGLSIDFAVVLKAGVWCRAIMIMGL